MRQRDRVFSNLSPVSLLGEFDDLVPILIPEARECEGASGEGGRGHVVDTQLEQYLVFAKIHEVGGGVEARELLGEDVCVTTPHHEAHERTHIPKYCTLYVLGELVDVLVGEGEREAVLAGL